MITADVGVVATGMVGVAAITTVPNVGSSAAVAIGNAVGSGSGMNGVATAVLGTLLGAAMGNPVLLCNCVGRTCVWEGVPIRSGCPQPAITSTVSSMYQRRTIAYNISRTDVLFKDILPRANGDVKHRCLGSSHRTQCDIIMSFVILYTVFKLLASVPKVPSNSAVNYAR
jgi:hypothetical protein